MMLVIARHLRAQGEAIQLRSRAKAGLLRRMTLLAMTSDSQGVTR